MKLIDADLLVATCKEIAKNEWNKKCAPVSWSDAYEGFIDTIDEMPDVDGVRVASEPCGFCARFDFGSVKAQIDKYGARIVTAVCCTEYPIDEQFNFCPVCGRNLRNGRNDNA